MGFSKSSAKGTVHSNTSLPQEIGEKKIKRQTDPISKANFKTKSWFFERINKTDKPLARLIKKQREKNQINKIRNENERSK